MRVCGIDCGTETTGYGVVSGMTPNAIPTWFLLVRAASALQKIAARRNAFRSSTPNSSPSSSATSRKLSPSKRSSYSVNARSAIRLGHVRGVALLAAATAGLPIAEYAPLTIKSTVTGYGLAAKNQVQFMVARLLALPSAPESADAADALAIAICHIHHAQTLSLQETRAV